VFTHIPIPNVPIEAIAPSQAPEILARVASTGVTVRNIEVFPLTANLDIESFRAPLELGAELGGERAVTIIHDTEPARAAENLARLCDMAAEYGMKVGLEFVGSSPVCASLDAAAGFVRQADKPNAGFCVDCLHLVRSGGTAEDVAAMPAELFSYSQICDGRNLERRSDYRNEVFERTVPGEGVFPIAAILDAIPAATPVEVEVPSLIAHERGIPAIDRARRAASATREFLDRAQPSR
jgi:sugar phosphate isomerase/epimerase